MIVIGDIFTKSDAMLRIGTHLKQPIPPLAYVGMVIPSPLWNMGYDYIASRRYQLMGRVAESDVCTKVSPLDRRRFIVDDEATPPPTSPKSNNGGTPSSSK
jgi:predicted DCC family thiol-disulfide oxidoreductase YuxK